MSLQEAYQLAHSAECRLRISTDRPDRNLRVVVGHLLHYESLRLRIVEIEHDISKNERARVARSQGAGQPKSATQRPSSPPEQADGEVTDSDDEDMTDSDHDDELELTRFDTNVPQLVEDDDDDFGNPEDPEPEDVEQALAGVGDDELAQSIENVRNCQCHHRTKSPKIEHVWALPKQDKPGVVRAIAQVA